MSRAKSVTAKPYTGAEVLDPIDIPRGKVSELLEDVRKMLAQRVDAEKIERHLERHGIPPLTKCPGPAHGNLYIDNCGVCAPRWGWTGPKVRVR